MMVDTSQGESRPAASAQRPVRPWRGPASGIAFIVLFVAAVFMDNLPAGNASDRAWTAYFASAAHRVSMIVSGFLLVAAALALLSFFVFTWTRVTRAARPGGTSLLPVAAAGVSAACIAAGGALGAVVPGSMVFGSQPEPAPGILRVLATLGIPLVLVGGMVPLALAVASLSLQAKAAGIFGRGMAGVGLAVAVITLFSFEFFTMLAMLAWVLAVSVVVIRRPELAPASHTRPIGSSSAVSPI